MIGYRVLHGVARVTSGLDALAFLYLFFAILSKHDVGTAFSDKSFALARDCCTIW